MLSVVIITCNRKKTLLKTISSCNEHISMRWELVVVDNGSTDGSQEAVETYCKEKKIVLNYRRMDHNLGVAAARNYGYKIARGNVLYFIDDDAYVISGGNSVDGAYNYLISHDNVQVLSNKIMDSLYGGVLPEFTEKNQPMESGVNLRSFIGASHFIKKNNIVSENLYPSNLFYGGEELYLSYKIHAKELRIEYYDGVAVQHNPSKNTRLSYTDTYINRILNAFLVKEYLFPEPYLSYSRILYFLRVLKFSKLNPNVVKKFRDLHRSRYNAALVENAISKDKIQEMINLFGRKSIL